ncbi:hypothetical protein B4589_000680 [Halolamina sp. CBA1230]|uniref:hypothetical protein n=1 Tax=Halolamina sp. CBA1230 TaxID=1853690 RepID=UPI001301B183|nr:hypothetical protein [Halolamina sp. CBA1230]QKY18957.1 hypothetical protein B4589_000680 [Halolamina sp. CBA1230]
MSSSVASRRHDGDPTSDERQGRGSATGDVRAVDAGNGADLPGAIPTNQLRFGEP